jgi:hypothetical protein
MSGYRTVQRRLHCRGREFHFVSYEGQTENPRRKQPAEPPTWYLVAAGKRWAVMPQEPGQDLALVDALLMRWLEEFVFAADEQDAGAAEDPVEHAH